MLSIDLRLWSHGGLSASARLECSMFAHIERLVQHLLPFSYEVNADDDKVLAVP